MALTALMALMVLTALMASGEPTHFNGHARL